MKIQIQRPVTFTAPDGDTRVLDGELSNTFPRFNLEYMMTMKRREFIEGLRQTNAEAERRAWDASTLTAPRPLFRTIRLPAGTIIDVDGADASRILELAGVAIVADENADADRLGEYFPGVHDPLALALQ